MYMWQRLLSFYTTEQLSVKGFAQGSSSGSAGIWTHDLLIRFIRSMCKWILSKLKYRSNTALAEKQHGGSWNNWWAESNDPTHWKRSEFPFMFNTRVSSRGDIWVDLLTTVNKLHLLCMWEAQQQWENEGTRNNTEVHRTGDSYLRIRHKTKLILEFKSFPSYEQPQNWTPT